MEDIKKLRAGSWDYNIPSDNSLTKERLESNGFVRLDGHWHECEVDGLRFGVNLMECMVALEDINDGLGRVAFKSIKVKTVHQFQTLFLSLTGQVFT